MQFQIHVFLFPQQKHVEQGHEDPARLASQVWSVGRK